VSKTIEPPVLLSRILTFVLATSVVVLGALVFTLVKMMPLERPEVFFLRTPTRSANITIKPIVPDSSNKESIDLYQRGFVRQYVISRNTIENTPGVTRKNWSKIVKPWSSPEVFAKLKKTSLYKEFADGEKIPNIKCDVDFSSPNNDKPILMTNKDGTYHVTFTWVCKNISGQTAQKDYKIRIRIKSDLDEKISGTWENLEKLRENPLGLQVVQYDVLNNRGDPLDSDIASW
jgi:type IV secretory pathway component VirB8